MEEEVRVILRQTVGDSSPKPHLEGVGSRILARFARLGGVELAQPNRADRPDAPYFGEVAR